MIDMFGEVGVDGCCGIVWGEMGLEGEGVDTALERQIFITLRDRT